jgi:thiol-disulfide isomerase/thioredoxin
LKRFLSDWSLALVASAVIVLVLGWLSRSPSAPEEAPDFSIETTQGESFTLSDYRGKTVVVNFWATWCGPCLKEIPHFSRFATENPDVTIIGIAVKSNPSEVTALEKKHAISYDIAISSSKDSILADYEMNTSRTVFPTTFVINSEGQIIGGRIERSLSYEELEEVVARASRSD